MKTKDALLLNNEERLEAVNMQREALEKQYSEALQRLEKEKENLEMEREKAKKELEEKEEQLRGFWSGYKCEPTTSKGAR